MTFRSHKVFSCHLFMLQLPALEDGCVATNWFLGTAQSTATCRPVNETFQNHFPKWNVCTEQCFSRNRNVMCLTLTFDLFQVQSIKCSRCPTHVFKQDKRKSSHQPIYITKKEEELNYQSKVTWKFNIAYLFIRKNFKKQFLPGLRGILTSRTGPNLAQTCFRSSSEHCNTGHVMCNR